MAEEEKQMSYEFTFAQKKNLGPEEQQGMIKAFRHYDKNKDGHMDESEFKNIMIDLGHRKITDDEVKKILGDHDENKDGVISWSEFVDMMGNMKGDDKDKFGTVIEGKRGAMAQVSGAHGGTHTYSLEEVGTFARLINDLLKDDEDLQDRLPMNSEDDSLFHMFDNGVMLCKLMMIIDRESIDERALNKQKTMNVYQIKENLQMAIAAAKGLGMKLVGINSSDFINKVPHMILACVWQTLKQCAAKSISLGDCPELMRLAEEGEELADLMKLTPDQILIRWVNFHLKAAGQDKRITNLGKDLADSSALFHVLNRLDSAACPLDGLSDEDLDSRATKMIANSAALGVPDIVRSRDICSGNTRVNTLFVAAIFNTKHGLEELNEVEKEAFDAAGLDDDDVEGSKEERTFRFWVNSLGIEDVYVDNLFDACNDGVMLCKIVDHLSPGAIDWKKVDKKPKNDFGKNINNNQAIGACKDALKLKMIGIGGVDLTKGDKKAILATMWQLVKTAYLKLIGGKTEDQLVQWANDSVGGKHPSIKNLKDKSMADGKFLIHLCAAIEERAVNWDIVTGGETDEDKTLNAKYAISVARKLGAVVFCVWEDIVAVNPKQMLIYVATMMDIQKNMAQ